MDQTDSSTRSESESEVDTAQAAASSGREYVSRAAPYLRQGIESGTVPAIIGGTSLLSGIRALRAGERGRGLVRLALGTGFVAAAIGQRRSRRSEESDVEQTDVVDTRPDVDAVADEAGGVEETDHATGDAAADVADESPDVEDTGSGLESDAHAEPGSVGQPEIADTGVDSADLTEATEREAAPDVDDGTTAETGADVDDGTETEEIDRLGEATFDRQSREVPAPQQAFNQGFLAHSSEAFWGINERNGGVVVSVDYDAIMGRDGVRYVASSEIDEDARELPIPDTVLNHWDEEFGGGTAVSGGDTILFVTSDDLAADGLLGVIPAEWAEELSP
ncbi:hypothetical protein [Halopiger thermotolerans]